MATNFLPLGNSDIVYIYELYEGAGNFIKLLDIIRNSHNETHLPVFCLVTQIIITQIMSDNG